MLYRILKERPEPHSRPGRHQKFVPTGEIYNDARAPIGVRLKALEKHGGKFEAAPASQPKEH